MNYRRLINVGGSETATPAVVEKPVVVEKIIEKEVIDKDTKDLLISIKDLMASRGEEEAPEWMKESTLTDDECAIIESFIMDVQKLYFPDIPLSPTLSRIFIYNIPRPVVDTAMEMHAKGELETLNPLFWFFMCCVDLTPEVFCKILKKVLDQFTTGEYERIKYYIGEEDDESDEEFDAPEMNPEDIDIIDADMPPEDIDESEVCSDEGIDSEETE
jgi:hypothetical protein